MVKQWALLVGLLLVASVHQTAAQWRIDTSRDEFTDEHRANLTLFSADDELMMGVFCIAGRPAPQVVVMIGPAVPRDRRVFDSGLVDLRWDGGIAETQTWQDNNRSISTPSGEILPRMLAADTVLMRVRTYPKGTITDSFRPSGLREALADVGCEP